MIMADDMGSWAMGCAGNGEIITPNIDDLAANGILFDNFYCVSPVCSPARASILTGKIPSQHGVHDWITSKDKEYSEVNFLENQTTYVDILKDNGYICGHSGKWHLGNSLVPPKCYDHWYAHASGGGPYYNAPMVRDGVIVRDPLYVTDLITDDSIEFIEKAHGGKPFYLSINYTAPHSPWLNNHPEEYTGMYRDCEFKTCPQEKEHPHSIYLTQEVAKDTRGNLTGYFASITAMDANIGRVIKTLERLSILEDTVIIFTSDNGFSCGQHGFWGKGNGTFPLNMYDVCVKVPFIFSHPSCIGKSERCSTVLSAYDLMPTLLDYIGLYYMANDDLPGKSFKEILDQPDCDQDYEAVVFDEYGPVRMIRSGDLKYIKRYPYGENEVYDLKNDPGEKVNLIHDDRYAAKVAYLNERLENWFERYGKRELDGSLLPVYGTGQLDKPSYKHDPHKNFVLGEYIKKTDLYKSMNPPNS